MLRSLSRVLSKESNYCNCLHTQFEKDWLHSQYLVAYRAVGYWSLLPPVYRSLSVLAA